MELQVRSEFRKVFGNLLNNDRQYHGRFISFANSWIPILFNVLRSSEAHPNCRFFISKKYASPVFDQRKAKATINSENKNITLLAGNTEIDLHRVLSAASMLNINSYVFCLLPHSDNLCKQLDDLSAKQNEIILMVDLDCLSHAAEESYYNKIMTRYQKLQNAGWNIVQLNNYNLAVLIDTVQRVMQNSEGKPTIVILKTNWRQMLIDL